MPSSWVGSEVGKYSDMTRAQNKHYSSAFFLATHSPEEEPDQDTDTLFREMHALQTGEGQMTELPIPLGKDASSEEVRLSWEIIIKLV